MDNEFTSEESDIEGINVTPLVDVCLVLVLIFMVTSPILVKNLVPVELPKAVTSRTEDQQNITITISPTEGFSINEVPIDRRALPQLLDRELEKSGFSFILIRADERVPHGEVEDVMKISKQLGAKRIAFATMPK